MNCSPEYATLIIAASRCCHQGQHILKDSKYSDVCYAVMQLYATKLENLFRKTLYIKLREN